MIPARHLDPWRILARSRGPLGGASVTGNVRLTVALSRHTAPPTAECGWTGSGAPRPLARPGPPATTSSEAVIIHAAMDDEVVGSPGSAQRG
jgi:hypothetical protein